eukprot:1157201-Pelagomonas_calceolata.AAC.9
MREFGRQCAMDVARTERTRKPLRAFPLTALTGLLVQCSTIAADLAASGCVHQCWLFTSVRKSDVLMVSSKFCAWHSKSTELEADHQYMVQQQHPLQLCHYSAKQHKEQEIGKVKKSLRKPKAACIKGRTPNKSEAHQLTLERQACARGEGCCGGGISRGPHGGLPPGAQYARVMQRAAMRYTAVEKRCGQGEWQFQRMVGRPQDNSAHEVHST